MATKDLKNNISDSLGVNIQSISSNTTTVGNIIDSSGFESITFIQVSSAHTDGTYTLLIEDGDDAGLSDAAAVADDFLIGTEAATAITTADSSTSIGYNGKKRYIRASIVSTGVTSGAALGCVVVRGDALTNPVA
jgi:hypothetical protein